MEKGCAALCPYSIGNRKTKRGKNASRGRRFTKDQCHPTFSGGPGPMPVRDNAKIRKLSRKLVQGEEEPKRIGSRCRRTHGTRSQRNMQSSQKGGGGLITGGTKWRTMQEFSDEGINGELSHILRREETARNAGMMGKKKSSAEGFQKLRASW